MADAKAKKTRTVKPVYVVMLCRDTGGNPIKLTKEDVDILDVYKDADALLSRLDSSDLPEGAFYKRIALG